MRHHPAGSVEPERRAARQHDGIDRLDAGVRLQERRIAHRRSAAVNGDGSRGWCVENNDGDAGGDGGVLRVTDQEARDVGDEVLHGREASNSRARWRVEPPR